MALGQSFILFIKGAESSRRFFDAIVDALKETFPDVGKFHWEIVDDKSGSSQTEETRLVVTCLDGLIAVCGISGEKLAKLQTENRDIAYLLKNNATFSEKLGFIESWLEDHELFFNDLWNALEGVFEKMSPSGELSLPAYACAPEKSQNKPETTSSRLTSGVKLGGFVILFFLQPTMSRKYENFFSYESFFPCSG
ncbi:hypothetical protein [uncultured Bilophila sp.]|uniref:hypothetical protein n=1 Tax=uncultured Bilophila sp. TaxID=529385 RepID=UPI00280BF9B3|nr:hypothetical protein [uncultured Bilophila sp.]